MTGIQEGAGSNADIMVPPEETETMMVRMLRMIAAMTIDERIAFASSMLPQCLGGMYANLDNQADRERLAAFMTEQVTSIVAAATAGPASSDSPNRPAAEQ